MQHRKDSYYTRAKSEGYRSRAAYKLLELQRRYHLLKRGDHVVDLGAWPGAWLQVALRLVGPRGRVVGVDIVAIDDLAAPNLTVLTADVLADKTPSAIMEALGRAPDVVLSDMAPKLTGVRPRDQARCEELEQAAFDFAVEHLVPGGRLVMKVLGETPLAGEARRRFRTAKLSRPEATRKGSTECYLIASGLRPASN